MINEKLGLDDYLVSYGKTAFTELINTAKEVDNIKEKTLCLLKNISAVNEAEGYEWVVKNLFAKKYISIYFSEPGIGKTWTTLDLGLKLSNGKSVFNNIETEKAKVLLFEGDAPDSLLKERINKFDAKQNDEYFKYVNRYTADRHGIDITLVTSTGLKNLELLISDFMPDMIIIDTLISFINDEKDAEEIRVAIDFLRKIAEKYNCHILVCHHSRKRESGEKKKKLDQSDVIGSSVISRLASVVIGIDKHEQNPLQRVLSLKKSWFRPFESLLFEIKDTLDGKIEINYELYNEIKSKVDGAIFVILDYIKNPPKAEFTRKELVDTFKNIPETTIKKALKVMEEEGYITSEGQTQNRVFKPITQ